MTDNDRAEGAHAALAAVLMATGSSSMGLRLCAALLDGAVKALRDADVETTELLGGVPARSAGLAELTRVCTECAACPRGRTPAKPALTLVANARVPPMWRPAKD